MCLAPAICVSTESHKRRSCVLKSAFRSAHWRRAGRAATRLAQPTQENGAHSGNWSRGTAESHPSSSGRKPDCSIRTSTPPLVGLSVQVTTVSNPFAAYAPEAFPV
ncbi:hypothetical protein SBBP2_570078 [Burkholderiales bacterium]|nr:hypothetical protein SBBP2_570078 [Burkholderiales bacterium]